MIDKIYKVDGTRFKRWMSAVAESFVNRDLFSRFHKRRGENKNIFYFNTRFIFQIDPRVRSFFFFLSKIFGAARPVIPTAIFA